MYIVLVRKLFRTLYVCLLVSKIRLPPRRHELHASAPQCKSVLGFPQKPLIPWQFHPLALFRIVPLDGHLGVEEDALENLFMVVKAEIIVVAGEFDLVMTFQVLWKIVSRVGASSGFHEKDVRMPKQTLASTFSESQLARVASEVAARRFDQPHPQYNGTEASSAEDYFFCCEFEA